ncbi:primosomal protein N' [Clostridium sp. MSJ-8]|uniref:primosomal protein N' n=1 Tax=Clostridium sp. MSJ-8 TaxID=2841510 RepID=UPI001C0E9397|nr:primosomal protein N' [Clostridium sp. MSJ-8]
MELFAEIIVNSEAYAIDKPFTYRVKEEFKGKIQVGHRVLIPFGIGNKFIEGFVIGLKCELDEEFKRIKSIKSILDEEPILSRDDLKVIDFLRENYLCKYIDAIRTIIPVGLLAGLKDKVKKVLCFKRELDGKLAEKENYINLIKLIRDYNCEYTKSEVIAKGYSVYSINKLISEGYIMVKEKVVYRYNDRSYIDEKRNTLNIEQKNAIKTIKNTDKRGILLKGITGSGKTEVYMNLVEDMIKSGKSAIMLVPEISLTPQMIERFKGRFGRQVSLYHSRLSAGERFDEWYRIKRGEVKLVVGARSAIFLPFDNLGLIIVDEEHENSYKSDNNPKYDTREVAKFLSEIKNCKYILGSATPSIETYYRATTKRELELVQINNRVKNNPLPEMHIVDMRRELQDRNMSVLSRKLQEEIKKALENKEQVILFLNRRGYSTFVSCRSCGYVFKCPECDIAMTYHRNGYLICHYCGRAIKETKICPKCKSKYVKFFGTGTEKVENEVKKIFKDARVMRMDIDTTRQKNSHEQIYNSFKNGDADILIGTQMVTKGLDFKNVTLVGILAADISLNIPDYRANERTFQIVTQVAGRAGRGDKRGKVIIQSYTPGNAILKYAMENNYKELYNEEIRIRKIMNYPPFCNIMLINMQSKDEEKLRKFITYSAEEIKNLLKGYSFEILGPSPCIITRIKEYYRWQVIIKGELNKKIKLDIKELLYELYKNVYNEIRINIDINPNNMS